jgi:hypothetical protein
MECLNCGNCQQGEMVYYCPARNDFVISQELDRVWIKERPSNPNSDEEDHVHSKKKRRLRKSS